VATEIDVSARDPLVPCGYGETTIVARLEIATSHIADFKTIDRVSATSGAASSPFFGSDCRFRHNIRHSRTISMADPIR
jgi:hypothetical protein